MPSFLLKRNDFRQWLRANAPRAKITSQYDISLNAVAVQLNGTPLEKIAAAPMVQQARYNALYYPNLSESYKIINASGAWTAAGGRATAGAGIKIGDIDAGIDETHPFFDPTGFSYPRASPNVMRRIALRTSQTRTANTFPQRLLLPRSFITRRRSRASTPKPSRTTGRTQLAMRLV